VTSLALGIKPADVDYLVVGVRMTGIAISVLITYRSLNLLVRGGVAIGTTYPVAVLVYTLRAIVFASENARVTLFTAFGR
jgi:hypothetical protein